MTEPTARTSSQTGEMPEATWNAPKDRHPDSGCELTVREREVLLTLELGESVAKIAKRLHVSVATVKTHVLHIYAKLSVHNRVQAVLAAQQLRNEAEISCDCMMAFNQPDLRLDGDGKMRAGRRTGYELRFAGEEKGGTPATTERPTRGRPKMSSQAHHRQRSATSIRRKE